MRWRRGSLLVWAAFVLYVSLISIWIVWTTASHLTEQRLRDVFAASSGVAAEPPASGPVSPFDTIMAVAALLGLPIGAASVILLWQNLRSTRIALEETVRTNRIARSEMRPWIALRRDLECTFTGSATGGRLDWNFDFENVGKSPAFKVGVTLELWRSDDRLGPPGSWDQFVVDVSTGAIGKVLVPLLFPGESTQFVRGRGYFSQTYKNAIRRVDGRVETIAVEGKYCGAFVAITYELDEGSNAPMTYDAWPVLLVQDDELDAPFTHKLLNHPERVIYTRPSCMRKPVGLLLK